MSNTFITKKTIKAKHAILNRKKELTPEGDHCGNDLWITFEQHCDPIMKEASFQFRICPKRHGNKRKYEVFMKKSRRRTKLLKEEREAFKNEEDQDIS
jgi:hypothetical protein